MINHIDKMADALIDVLKYSASEVEWVEADDVQPNDGLDAEWFYPAIESAGYSEISAILQYTQQQGVYDDEAGELFLGIALVEMKHYAAMRDIILRLGGKLPRPYAGTNVVIGDSLQEALELAIKSEMETIDFYHSVEQKITQDTPSTRIAKQILEKIIADETLHLNLLNRKWVEVVGHQALKNMGHLVEKIKSYFVS